MRIREITTYLESIAPLHLQEDYDNAGLLVGSLDDEVESTLICLDVTPAIVDEAIEKGCGLIIGHHPVIFRGLKRLTGETFVEKAVIQAIRHGIAIYAIHTNLDNILQDGVNGMIADRLGLTDRHVLAPREDPGMHDVGAGMVGTLPKSMSEGAFLDFLRVRMELRVIRHTRLLGVPVSKVAVCGGSGSFLLARAIASGAQVYVSADFKYHDFFDAEDRI